MVSRDAIRILSVCSLLDVDKITLSKYFPNLNLNKITTPRIRKNLLLVTHCYMQEVIVILLWKELSTRTPRLSNQNLCHSSSSCFQFRSLIKGLFLLRNFHIMETDVILRWFTKRLTFKIRNINWKAVKLKLKRIDKAAS